jgi:FMN phosphatase YigB (HAD superfamily)
MLIDLDDTLIPDTAARNQALFDTLADSGVRLALDDVLSVIREQWRLSGLRELPQLAGVSSWEALWTDFAQFADLTGEARDHGTEFQAQTWAALIPNEDPAGSAITFREHREAAVVPFGWVDTVLLSLTAQHTLWCATNGSSMLQRRKLMLAGLSDRFERTFISGEIGAVKNSEPFARTVGDALAESGQRAVGVVGDSEESDGALADALGIAFTRVVPGRDWTSA